MRSASCGAEADAPPAGSSSAEPVDPAQSVQTANQIRQVRVIQLQLERLNTLTTAAQNKLMTVVIGRIATKLPCRQTLWEIWTSSDARRASPRPSRPRGVHGCPRVQRPPAAVAMRRGCRCSHQPARRSDREPFNDQPCRGLLEAITEFRMDRTVQGGVEQVREAIIRRPAQEPVCESDRDDGGRVSGCISRATAPRRGFIRSSIRSLRRSWTNAQRCCVIDRFTRREQLVKHRIETVRHGADQADQRFGIDGIQGSVVDLRGGCGNAVSTAQHGWELVLRPI